MTSLYLVHKSIINQSDEKATLYYIAAHRHGVSLSWHASSGRFVPSGMDFQQLRSVLIALPDYRRSHCSCGDSKAKSPILRTPPVSNWFSISIKRLNNVINFVEQCY